MRLSGRAVGREPERTAEQLRAPKVSYCGLRLRAPKVSYRHRIYTRGERFGDSVLLHCSSYVYWAHLRGARGLSVGSLQASSHSPVTCVWGRGEDKMDGLVTAEDKLGCVRLSIHLCVAK